MMKWGKIVGFPDLGKDGAAVVDVGGWPSAVPANNIMTIMLTSADGDWKCPLAYFIISSKF